MRTRPWFLALSLLITSAAPMAYADGARRGPDTAKSPKREPDVKSPKRDDRPNGPEVKRPDDRPNGQPNDRPGGPNDKPGENRPDQQGKKPGNQPPPQWGKKGPHTPPPDMKPAREELSKTRDQRAKDRREALQKEWGKHLAKPAVREEVQTHERRLAHLNYLKESAKAKGKTASVTRADELIRKENLRYQAAMKRLTGGGQ